MRIRLASYALYVAAALACTASAAYAHSFSQASLQLTFADTIADGQWRIALRDLDALLGLDADRDGHLSMGELAALSSYLLDRLELHADGAACTLAAAPSSTTGDYLHFQFRATCPAAPQRITVRYDLFFDHDPQHTSQLIVGDATLLLRADARVVELVVGKSDLWQEALAYLEQGVWHIWTGYDHILFLCTLLLPALGMRADKKPALLEVLRIVSAFTLAHSLTLSLAALQVVELPSRWVEATIAASVCWAALNNIYQWVTRRIWLVVFGFGLVHGFGFASVLHELGLPGGHLLAALVAFNVGVELGQLAIVLTVLPLAFALQRVRWYSARVLSVGSLAIAAVGGAWLLERALDASLPRAFSQLTAAAEQEELSVLLRAAQQASEQRAFDKAAAILERASLVAEGPSESEVWRRMGAVRVAQGDLPAAHAAYERAHATSQDLRATADAERGLGMVAKLSGDRALAMRRYRHALASNERLGLDTRTASDATELAALYLDAGLYSDAEAMYTRALGVREAQHDDAGVAQLSAALGALQHRRSAPDAAAPYFERAATLHERGARPIDAANQYANLAQVRRDQGKLDEASALYTRSLNLFQQHGQLARAGKVQQLMAELGAHTEQPGSASH